MACPTVREVRDTGTRDPVWSATHARPVTGGQSEGLGHPLEGDRRSDGEVVDRQGDHAGPARDVGRGSGRGDHDVGGIERQGNGRAGLAA